MEKLIAAFLLLFKFGTAAELKENILDKKQQEIVTIAAFTASSDLEKLAGALEIQDLL